MDKTVTPEDSRVNLESRWDPYIRGNMYQHQRVAWDLTCQSPKTALLMEQGTGKTLVAIAAIGYYAKKMGLKHVLVVAPLSVIPFWVTEVKRFADYQHTVVDLTRCKEVERNRLLKSAEKQGKYPIIALINYESTWRYFPRLLEWWPTMIVCDESQKIKSYRTKQSKAMHKLGDKAPYKIIMSGTPVTQSPMDIWSQYRFLDQTIFGDNYFRFRSRYAVMGGWQRKQIVSYRHLTELARRAHSIAYRVKKVDALTLPPQVDSELYVRLCDKARGIYRQLEENFAVMLESGNTVTVPIVLTQLLRLQQVTGGFVKNDQGEMEQVDDTKLKELKSFLEDLPTGKKVVIFCRFIAEVAGIYEMAKDMGLRSILLHGGTKDRGEAIRVFQEDPDYRLFIAQIQTGSLGITLTAADTVVFYSTTFGYADYEQAKARIHRVGQRSSSVTYVHLMAKDTIDEDILKALREKRDVADYIVDKLKRKGTEKSIYTSTSI